MNTFIGIIPARFLSTRFPGKPLIDIAGKKMIQRVYERATKILKDVVVATDDSRIENAVKEFGGNVVITSDQHKTGTDRCLEALDKFQNLSGKEFSVIINIQGDEPFIKEEQIIMLQKCFDDPVTQIATLIKPIDDNKVIFDPNRPKVIIDKNRFAIYFSRSPIPHIHEAVNTQWCKNHIFYQHIGMYAYRVQTLKEITSLPLGILEKAEALEQLRWIENGYKIKTAVTEYESYSIDTPKDLERVLQLGIIEANEK